MIPLPSLTGGRSREHSRLAKASVENIIKDEDLLKEKFFSENLRNQVKNLGNFKKQACID